VKYDRVVKGISIEFISLLTGGLFTKSLKVCPKCHAKLKLSSDSETQYCIICKYWTKVGTARLDSIMIFA
jgi:hypothetical protein